MRRTEKEWSTFIMSKNGTMHLEKWRGVEGEERLKYIQAFIRIQLTNQKVLFTHAPFKEASFCFGTCFAFGLFAILGELMAVCSCRVQYQDSPIFLRFLFAAAGVTWGPSGHVLINVPHQVRI
jgi:hypothetical protein